MDESMGRLLDDAAITRLLHVYARALDTRDWLLLESCFLPDAVADFGETHGPTPR